MTKSFAAMEYKHYDCHKCIKAAGGLFLPRMVLCPECGNKRCPKASDHEMPCTHSNLPGQPGSVYGGSAP